MPYINRAGISGWRTNTHNPTPQLVGYYGVVAKANAENLETPQIILYETRKHQKVKPILIDLSDHTGFELEVIT